MTISLQANAAGNAGQINIGATPVVSLLVASGLPFCKNKLFNGEVTRINQRGFDGNWATKNMWSAGNTVAQQELCYGYDMWARSPTPGNMVQAIEAGNFRPSTVHTVSCGNGAFVTYQLTSPASGNWTIDIPQASRNVQVEEGSVATPFEVRPYGFELAQCQRYYERGRVCFGIIAVSGDNPLRGSTRFLVSKRIQPSVTMVTPIIEGANVQNGTFFVNGLAFDSIVLTGLSGGAGEAFLTQDWTASAVI